jgi:hypothetical protein
MDEDGRERRARPVQVLLSQEIEQALAERYPGEKWPATRVLRATVEHLGLRWETHRPRKSGRPKKEKKSDA